MASKNTEEADQPQPAPQPRRMTKAQLVMLAERLIADRVAPILSMDNPRRLKILLRGATADGKGMIVEIR